MSCPYHSGMLLHHVQLAIPAGGEDRAREYWIGLLGFAEKPKPEPMASRGGLWLVGGAVEIHLGAEDPFTPATRAHPGILVEDLDALESHLRDHGHDTRHDAGFDGYRRFHSEDPFGNRLEFMGT
jgi:hypothetical protein